jgi:hypothetical protein
MLVTLSERRLSERIKQLEGINDSPEEITFRMSHYASRLFAHVNEFGVRFVGMVGQSGGLGTFQFSIDGVGRDWQTGDFNWQKLAEGLSYMDPVAVSIEEQDMRAVCVGLVASMAVDSWDSYASELQSISVNEIQPRVEAVLLRLHTQPREISSFDRTGVPEYDRQMQEQEDIAQLQRVGDDPQIQALLRDLEKQRQQRAFDEAEIATYQAQEDRAYKARRGIDRS